MLLKVTHFFKIYSLPLISGVLTASSYIPFPPWALFFCLAPLWHFCLNHRHNPWVLIKGAWLCQFVFTLIGFHWVIYTIHTYGQMNWFISLLGFLLFCSLAHLHIPAGVLVWSWMIRLKGFQKEWVAWILLPVLTSIAATYIPMLFQWHFGYPWLWAGFPAFHTAELWGFQFIGTLTLLFQLCFLALRKKGLFKILFPIGVGAFLILNLLGFALSARLQKPDQQAQVLMVQHNMGNLLYASPRILKKALFQLMNLTQESLKTGAADFILWPEGAYPYLLSEDDPASKPLQKRVKKYFKTPLAAGGIGHSQGELTNSIFFFDKEGNFSPARYDKNHLLAFGEYIPGERWLPWLRKVLLGSTRRIRASREGPAVREIEGLRLGLQICYESLFDSFSRTLSQKKADILINVTNDSWFGWWYEPYQHLYMTLARSIEVRKPMARLTTTGISAVITARGEIIAKSPLRKPWSQVVSVPYSSNPSPSLFEGWGYYINSFILFFLLCVPFFAYLFSKFLSQSKVAKFLKKQE